MTEFVKAASVSELQPGSVKEIQINGRTLAICNVAGKCFALDNQCAHRGGPLGQGILDGENIECPWHGWRFDVKTGAVGKSANVKVVTYEVKIEGSDILVAI